MLLIFLYPILLCIKEVACIRKFLDVSQRAHSVQGIDLQKGPVLIKWKGLQKLALNLQGRSSALTISMVSDKIACDWANYKHEEKYISTKGPMEIRIIYFNQKVRITFTNGDDIIVRFKISLSNYQLKDHISFYSLLLVPIPNPYEAGQQLSIDTTGLKLLRKESFTKMLEGDGDAFVFGVAWLHKSSLDMQLADGDSIEHLTFQYWKTVTEGDQANQKDQKIVSVFPSRRGNIGTNLFFVKKSEGKGILKQIDNEGKVSEIGKVQNFIRFYSDTRVILEIYEPIPYMVACDDKTKGTIYKKYSDLTLDDKSKCFTIVEKFEKVDIFRMTSVKNRIFACQIHSPENYIYGTTTQNTYYEKKEVNNCMEIKLNTNKPYRLTKKEDIIYCDALEMQNDDGSSNSNNKKILCASIKLTNEKKAFQFPETYPKLKVTLKDMQEKQSPNYTLTSGSSMSNENGYQGYSILGMKLNTKVTHSSVKCSTPNISRNNFRECTNLAKTLTINIEEMSNDMLFYGKLLKAEIRVKNSSTDDEIMTTKMIISKAGVILRKASPNMKIEITNLIEYKLSSYQLENGYYYPMEGWFCYNIALEVEELPQINCDVYNNRNIKLAEIKFLIHTNWYLHPKPVACFNIEPKDIIQNVEDWILKNCQGDILEGDKITEPQRVPILVEDLPFIAKVPSMLLSNQIYGCWSALLEVLSEKKAAAPTTTTTEAAATTTTTTEAAATTTTTTEAAATTTTTTAADVDAAVVEGRSSGQA